MSSADAILRWSYSEDGWPVLLDGSLAVWFRTQRALQAQRGVELESNAARVAKMQALGLTVAGGLAATPAAPIGALVGLAVALSRVGGGLQALNDLDGDGRPDHLYAPTPEEQVHRVMSRNQLPRPLGLGMAFEDAFVLAVKSQGIDKAVWWLFHAARVFGEHSNPATFLPRGALPRPAPGPGALTRPE